MERQRLLEAIPHCLTHTDLPLPSKYPGKVRDTYEIGDGRLLLVTTDRQSGFDRLLGAIPYKGQVLNRTSLYWFEQDSRHYRQSCTTQPTCECFDCSQVQCAADRICGAGIPDRIDRHLDLDAVSEGRKNVLRPCATGGHEKE